MKKFLATCLCLVLLVCTTLSVSAVEPVNTIPENHELATFQVTVGENGTHTIVPYNTDLKQVTGPYWQGSVNVSTGKNMKVHVYIDSYAFGSNQVDIYVKPESSAGALDSRYKVATWTGTGHHCAELAMGTTYTSYYVMLWGAFNGSGAIYTEP